MNSSTRVPFALATLSLLALAAPARATTVTECHAAIQVVRGDLAGVVVGGNNPDLTRASLDSKLTGADLKLDQGKFFDAATKLSDFRQSAATLQSQGKLSDGTTTVAQLLQDADAASACVQSLLSQ